MTGRRSRLWRWALLVWAVLVVVAGGLTLWLQDSTEPPGPYVWEQSSPTPSLSAAWPSACADVTPDEQGWGACLTVTSG
ncbi:hypothetical protein [Streptomyces griseorubiginosus]|uniref:Uncharacterized protein n=1 Tax=Streptomyces griseorubiginosus TaxID=67304 RepID=A0AAI8KZQ6_9ACTN|nr:hypothetical protein [Streptomyces griseorubiginosus]AYC38651.1 hypothetical protein DWG14_02881 [Streptomyces griseorubiginosus]